MTNRSASRFLATAAVAFLLLSIVGCNDNDTNITTPSVADVSMELVPTEGQTKVSTDLDYDWMVSLEMVLTEHGGDLGLDIDGILVEIEEAQGGISVGSQDGDTYRHELKNPTERVEPGETATIGIDVFYSFESGGRESLIEITVVIVDDNSQVLVGVAEFHGLP
jgi:hypothetical protein